MRSAQSGMKKKILLWKLYVNIGKKAKCTLVQALRLCTGRTAHRGSRGTALLFLDHGTRRGWLASVTPRPLFTPGKDPVPIFQEAGWAPGPVWTGAENFAPSGIRSPDRPARSQSLYPLRYPAHRILVVLHKLFHVFLPLDIGGELKMIFFVCRVQGVSVLKLI